MKLRTVKKILFREISLSNLKPIKPAYNSFALLEFSEHKKYRRPLKGLKYFFHGDKDLQKVQWTFEKEEWYYLLNLLDYYRLPNKFRGYAKAYCQWYERHLKNA